MRKLCVRFFVLLGSCALLSLGCSNPKPLAEGLIQASQLMKERPDSVLLVLQSVPAPEKMSASDYAYYCLLLTEARDKTYYKFTSDSTIHVALSYYEAKKDKLLLPKAYYYTGRVYHTLRDSPQAISYYLKAIDALPKDSDYALEARIHNMLGNLYLLLRFNENATQAYQKAYDRLSLAEDSVNLPYILRDMARTYDASEKRDSAILYYDRAISLAAEVKNLNAEQSSRAELMSVLLREGNLLKAEEHKGKVLGLYGTEKKTPQFLLILGDYYNQIGKPDSARYYFNQSLDTDNIYTHAASIRELALLEEKEQNYEQAIFLHHRYIVCKDSIEKMGSKKSVSDMVHYCNYQFMEAQKNKLEAENARAKLVTTRVYFSIALFTLLLVALFLYYRQRKEKELWAKERVLRYQEEQYRNSQKKVEDNLLHIQRLKEELEANSGQLSQVSEELLQAKKTLLQQENKGIEISLHSKDLQRKKLFESLVYKELKSISSGELMTPDVWECFKREMDAIYDGFDTKLSVLYPSMSEIELKVCYLIKSGFNVTEISSLLGRTKPTITLCRKRLYTKIKGVEGTAEDLDQLILNFC